MRLPLLAGTRSDEILQAIGRAALAYEYYNRIDLAVLHVRTHR
jgi:hypothetical protein